MKELSLNILDIVENSTKAKAETVFIERTIPIYFAGVPSANMVYFLSKLSTRAPRHTSIFVSLSSSMPSKSGHFFKIFKKFFNFFSFC